MELEFDAEQEALAASVKAVLAREWNVGRLRELVEKGTGAEALWEVAVGLDWPALTVPEADGGMGLGPVEAALVFEQLGAVVAPGPLLPTLGLFVPLVREAGTAEQRGRLLGAVAAGTLTGTAALTEVAPANDAADVRAAALSVVATPARDGWSLTGTARSVIEGDTVDQVVVPARVGDDGVGLFVVPVAAATATPVRSIDATRRIAHLRLDSVAVPAADVLGVPGDPATARALRRGVDEATAALAAELVGTLSTIYEIAHAYAGSRVQFGVKIGSFQAIKHKLVDCYVALEAARATAYFAAAAIAEDDDRRTTAASMAKALAGDAERRVAQEGIQVLGGIGYTWEHDMHLYVKRAMGSAGLLGGAEAHRQRVAALLGLVAA